VSKDAVLRIERGTTIYSGRDAMLTAIGKLETFGNDEELVQFRALLPAEPWDGIRLENPGELTVSGIDVRGARVGVHVVSGKQTVRDSIAAHNEIGVKILSPGSSGQRRPIKIRLRGCVIADNQRDGISVRGHRFGLDHCTITDNGGAGLRMTYYGYPEIKACVFARNEIGIASGVHSTRVEMSGSAVLLNRAAAIEVKSPEDFDCRGNFWGTKDPRFISATLRDGADNPGLGHVLFEPFETKPIKDAGSPLWDSVWVKEKASQRRRVRRR
jgi:nitrous oxidase accessory protein NosD